MDIGHAAVVPVITALVAAIGMAAPALPRRLYPVLSIGLGIGWVALSAAPGGAGGLRGLADGIVLGLAASGLYSSGVKPLRGQAGGAA